MLQSLVLILNSYMQEGIDKVNKKIVDSYIYQVPGMQRKTCPMGEIEVVMFEAPWDSKKWVVWYDIIPHGKRNPPLITLYRRYVSFCSTTNPTDIRSRMDVIFKKWNNYTRP